MIKTTYFARVSELKSKHPEAVFVSISRFSPKGWKGFEMKSLAPSFNLLRDYKQGKIDADEYIERYISEVVDPKAQLLKEMKRRAEGKLVYLCCYEGKYTFCHRHLLGFEEEE